MAATVKSILQRLFGFGGSTTLTALELEVFTKLAGGSLDVEALRGELGLRFESAPGHS